MTRDDVESPDTAASFWSAFLIGVGLMAAIDEIIFHQILGWHHFYDLSTPAIGLLSDGLLHAAELMIIVAGFFYFSDVRQRNVLDPSWAWAGGFLGAGVFQVLDGILFHKVLRIHQIRYGVYLLPYDVAWFAAGAALILTGWVLLARARSARLPGAAHQA